MEAQSFPQSFSFKGVLVRKDKTEQINDRLTKRVFIVRDDKSQYPQEIKFEAINGCALALNRISENAEVVVNFNLRGKAHNGKHYNNIEAWSIEDLSKVNSTGSVLPGKMNTTV